MENERIKHHGLQGLRTLDLNLRIEKSEEILKNSLGLRLNGADSLILRNQVAIMQALVDIINEMQKPQK